MPSCQRVEFREVTDPDRTEPWEGKNTNHLGNLLRTRQYRTALHVGGESCRGPRSRIRARITKNFAEGRVKG
ncbi:hypothetical protein FA13DRAFT_1737072 [Coprinellus micaceus]|uniref:Uncharacterized protein n=1 Tax=Coprinellus micaceus TaxID=71717 RepID=A0A4Y7SYC9_COPMI|nr:hypothetical protein FA13DRAFT_1737072 [Coprinellus micaceus]